MLSLVSKSSGLPGSYLNTRCLSTTRAVLAPPRSAQKASARHRLASPRSVANPESGPRFRRSAGPGNGASPSQSPRYAASRPSRFVSERPPRSAFPRTTQDASSSSTPPHRYQAGATRPPATPSGHVPWSQRERERESSPQKRPLSLSPRKTEFASQPTTQPIYSSFSTPPLLPGLLKDLLSLTGSGKSSSSQPFPIQALSMSHFFPSQSLPQPGFPPPSSQTLLASETGSGKSIAYLLPLIQGLKATETPPAALGGGRTEPSTMRPRALVLAPTHELCRQLSTYTKALSHEVKLRTLCLSNPVPRSATSARGQKTALDHESGSSETFVVRQPDIVIGTPSRIAQMASLEIETDEESPSVAKRAKPAYVPSSRELDLAGLEWVIIDEADVMFDRDFRQTVHGILDAARNAKPSSVVRATKKRSSEADAVSTVLPTAQHLPFNLILTTATIPSSLNTHFLTHFPSLVRLASPKLHRLPSKMHTDRVDIKGQGNPFAAIAKKLQEILSDQTRLSGLAGSKLDGEVGRVILFCNQTKKAEELGAYLKSGIKVPINALVMTGASEERRRGSNNHLEAFLNLHQRPSSSAPTTTASSPSPSTLDNQPRVLITTSLLARGLDFSPSVSHVLIVDEPRNEVDFLHRAGRTGRAGRPGTVVVFGKGMATTRGRGPKKVGFA